MSRRLAFLYYSSIFCKWWDLGGMTSIYIKIGGIHPTSNCPQPTTPRISLLLHVESKSYKKLTALIMHSCPCYESILLIWSWHWRWWWWWFVAPLSPKLLIALARVLDELERDQNKENHLHIISKMMGTLVHVQLYTFSYRKPVIRPHGEVVFAH